MISKKIRIALRILIILVLLFSFAVIGVIFGYNYVLSQEKRFDALSARIEAGAYKDLKADTPGVVTVVINTGDSTSDIAERLYDAGLVSNTFIFSLLSKINGFDGSYVAGTHYLLNTFSYDELMYFLTLEPASVKVTIPEGLTYQEIKQLLWDAGLTFDEAEMDECMNSTNLFVDYDFVSQIELNDDRDYVLDGYLYPDTYIFDINASPESIIRKFLSNMDSKLYSDYYARAKKLGMSMDEVITLASIIQAETGRISDMMYISAVFHNRLNSSSEADHILGSSATINYIIKTNGGRATLNHTSEQLNADSPYNTYTHPGLPPGPICMPGNNAIAAALYPEPNCNYMFFCATGDGGTAYATTLAQHEANVAKYSSSWEEIDREAEERERNRHLNEDGTVNETTAAGDGNV
ncbi:MAG: endolytic transglycosylase MltG [Clostridiales bacterium]|nr:endolytic transglycosylase MltG [Clostridiales bacterium]